MKTLWTAVSILAVANLLALAGFVAWLGLSDRLDTHRVQEVRLLLSETVAEREARAQEEEAAAATAAAIPDHDADAGARLPVAAADALMLKLQQNEVDQLRLEAREREVRLLQETLRRQKQQLEDDREALAGEREEFERARRAIAETEGTAQFRKALATLEGLKPDRAKLALDQLIRQGEIEQVVAYLNGMQERTRVRVLDEFLGDDPALAADLLERLRTRGLAARGAQGAP